MHISGQHAHGITSEQGGDGTMNHNPATSHASAVPKAAPCNSKVELGAEKTLPPGFQKFHRKCLESSDTSPYAFLNSFDTIFSIDDSGTMASRPWQEITKALKNVIPTCTQYDGHGIDLYSLNDTNSSLYKNITSIGTVVKISQTVRPSGARPTVQYLQEILKPYPQRYEKDPNPINPANPVIIADGESTNVVEAPVIVAVNRLDNIEVPAWQVGNQFSQVGKNEGVHAALEQLDDGLTELSGDEGILMPYLQKATLARYRAFPKTAPKDYDHSGTIFRSRLLRINPVALAFLTVFTQLPIIQAAPQHISTTWGIPVSNTFGLGTGLAISVFDDEVNTHPVLYWIVYGFWSLSALLVVAFTTFSIKKSSRVRYLCTFVLVEFILLTVIAVSSMRQGLVTKHIKEWTPLATVAVASALKVGFKKVA